MGSPKANLLLADRTLACRTADVLADVAAPVLEVGPGYTGLPRVIEDRPGQGPFAALAAAAAHLATRYQAGPALVVATDLPNLTPGLLRLLADWPEPGCAVPLDGGYPQLLCARYSPEALALAPGLVEAGYRSLRDLVARVPVSWLEPAQWVPAAGRPDVLFDVDTPEDLARVRDDA
jgi:molybdopterin-guanine dinucleotide biosynthesis protein A